MTRAAVVGAAVLLLAGCAAPVAPERARLPPTGATFDDQLGGAYDPPDGVEVVARDSTAEPPPAGTTSATSTGSRPSRARASAG